MSDYFAKVTWARADNETFVDNKYSRGHAWEFDGGAVVAASASPHIVPPPFSVAANVDPEEALVAALSSCHMLFFLALAGKQKFVVDEYTDNATSPRIRGIPRLRLRNSPVLSRFPIRIAPESTRRQAILFSIPMTLQARSRPFAPMGLRLALCGLPRMNSRAGGRRTEENN